MDLASVMSESEHAEISSRLTGVIDTWIGLYRKSWSYWSDQLSVNFTNWREDHPRNYISDCVRMSTHTGEWLIASCDKKFAFVCQEKTTAQDQARLKVKISSGADMNDPEVQRQLLQQV